MTEWRRGRDDETETEGKEGKRSEKGDKERCKPVDKITYDENGENREL